MSKCSAKFVAALFVSVLAGAHLATVTDLRAQAASRRRLPDRAKGRDHPRAAIGITASIARPNVSAGIFGKSDKASDKSTRATPPVSPPATSAAAAEPAEQHAAYDHAQSDLRRARRIYLPAIPRRTDAPCQSRSTNDRRSDLHTGRSGQQAHASAQMCSRQPRWPRHDCSIGSSVNASSNPADVRTAAVADPPADQQQRRRAGAATSPATACSQRGDCARRCGLIDDEANGVVADAACGDGCRACAGRHHGEPGLQAGPHPRAARHAASAACDVGFSQNQASSAATAFGAADTCSTAPRGQRRRCGQRRRRSIARKPGRGVPRLRTTPRPQEARPRPQEARERQVTDMLARLARSAPA